MRSMARRLARLEARDIVTAQVFVSVGWAMSMQEANQRHFGPQGRPPGVFVTYIVSGLSEDALPASAGREKSNNGMHPDFDAPNVPPKTDVLRILNGMPEDPVDWPPPDELPVPDDILAARQSWADGLEDDDSLD